MRDFLGEPPLPTSSFGRRSFSQEETRCAVSTAVEQELNWISLCSAINNAQAATAAVESSFCAFGRIGRQSKFAKSATTKGGCHAYGVRSYVCHRWYWSSALQLLVASQQSSLSVNRGWGESFSVRRERA